jgi:hypothetical protein
MGRLPALSAAAMLAVLAACADWPRFDHLERDDTGGAPPPGAVQRENPVHTWTDIGPVADPADDTPAGAIAESYAAGQGIRLVGTLQGAGWAEGEVPARGNCEGTPLAFPTEDLGNYRGDLDWRSVQITEAGVFCSRFVPALGVARVDVLIFRADPCGTAGEALLDRDGLIVGFSPSEAENDWSTPVSVGAYVLVAAAWQPDDPQLWIDYTWDLALLDADAGRADCAAVER